jgi:hypothetical protein
MVNYKESIKRETVDAIRQAFVADFGDWSLVKDLKISLEYPQSEVHYPMIIVNIREKELYSAGVGHYEIGVNETGEQVMMRHFRFDAALEFKIHALSSIDRDQLSSILVGILAFPAGSQAGNVFYRELVDSEFIDMQMNNDVITPGGDGVENVPWDDPTRKVYTATYSIPIIGEFWTRENGVTLITIRDVRIYPYRPDQTEPVGSTDPRDISTPWIPEPGPAWTPGP